MTTKLKPHSLTSAPLPPSLAIKPLELFPWGFKSLPSRRFNPAAPPKCLLSPSDLGRYSRPGGAGGSPTYAPQLFPTLASLPPPLHRRPAGASPGDLRAPAADKRGTQKTLTALPSLLRPLSPPTPSGQRPEGEQRPEGDGAGSPGTRDARPERPLPTPPPPTPHPRRLPRAGTLGRKNRKRIPSRAAGAQRIPPAGLRRPSPRARAPTAGPSGRPRRPPAPPLSPPPPPHPRPPPAPGKGPRPPGDPALTGCRSRRYRRRSRPSCSRRWGRAGRSRSTFGCAGGRSCPAASSGASPPASASRWPPWPRCRGRRPAGPGAGAGRRCAGGPRSHGPPWPRPPPSVSARRPRLAWPPRLDCAGRGADAAERGLTGHTNRPGRDNRRRRRHLPDFSCGEKRRKGDGKRRPAPGGRRPSGGRRPLLARRSEFLRPR